MNTIYIVPLDDTTNSDYCDPETAKNIKIDASWVETVQLQYRNWYRIYLEYAKMLVKLPPCPQEPEEAKLLFLASPRASDLQLEPGCGRQKSPISLLHYRVPQNCKVCEFPDVAMGLCHRPRTS